MMSPVFNDYSKYYNLLYKDKPYGEESRYVFDKIQKYNKNAKTLLDVGCGTGKHCSYFHEYGLDASGIDLSQEMISIAQKNYPEFKFTCCDMAAFKTDKIFDVVTSLFHVMSYQTETEQFIECLSNIRGHLKQGGLFLFDCWYGPGVLTDRPAVRVKRFEDDLTEALRIAEPAMDSNQNTVDVTYTIFVKDKSSELFTNLQEVHKMRYFFLPELELMLKLSGFKLIESAELLTNKPLDFNSWTAFFVAEKE